MKEKYAMLIQEKIAVIDTETNFDDEVMSIGIVVAEAGSYKPVDSLYLVLDPAYKRPAMYSLQLDSVRAGMRLVLPRKQALARTGDLLQAHQVRNLFAYNARFDKSHLPELGHYGWHDIMKIAAYRQYNSRIPAHVECCSTGRIKRGYGVQDVYRMLAGTRSYQEVHNALADAEDELAIMRMLGHDLQVYESARI